MNWQQELQRNVQNPAFWANATKWLEMFGGAIVGIALAILTAVGVYFGVTKGGEGSSKDDHAAGTTTTITVTSTGTSPTSTQPTTPATKTDTSTTKNTTVTTTAKPKPTSTPATTSKHASATPATPTKPAPSATSTTPGTTSPTATTTSTSPTTPAAPSSTTPTSTTPTSTTTKQTSTTSPVTPVPVPVAMSLATPGDYGFACHRIPALTTSPNGDLLAAWDGRPDDCKDAPQPNTIIQKRSTDGGLTWSEPTYVAKGFPGTGLLKRGKYGYSDPSYVVDEEEGAIYLFFVKSYDVTFQASKHGTDPNERNVLHAAVAKSTDNGHTWSEPRIITKDITAEPNNWRSRFATSGEGIQLKYGPNKGRLIQPYVIADTSQPTRGVPRNNQYRAVMVYSDDHGATWKVGRPFGNSMDENKVVELSDGTVMVNSRRSDGETGRKIAYSRDGGITFGPVTDYDKNALPDPRNNASFIRAYPNAPQGSDEAKILLFSNAASNSARETGTIRISYDDGKTWSNGRRFKIGEIGYSSLTKIDDEHYGLLFEARNGNGDIRFERFHIDWVKSVN